MFNDYSQNLAQRLRVSVRDINQLNSDLGGNQVIWWLESQERNYKQTEYLISDFTRSQILGPIHDHKIISANPKLKLLAWYLLNTARVPAYFLNDLATVGYERSAALTRTTSNRVAAIIKEAASIRGNKPK